MRFAPIHTERLIIRATRLTDAEAAYNRRRLPEVARYQDWELPYTRAQAEQRTAQVVAMGGPADGAGWSATVVDAAHPERILGDVYVGISWGGRTAEVGYTFHPDHWGRGYATEATEAMIGWLITAFGVNRIEASAHPDNPASLRVLEHCGLRYEGQTRQSFWVGDSCSDNITYGMLRPEWDDWRARPRDRPQQVELEPIGVHNRAAVSALASHKSQERFVSPIGDSFSHIVAPPSIDGAAVVPWYRAIRADGEVVGFLLAAEATSRHSRPRLWRLLIDRRHQRRGIGSAALAQFERHWRSAGATEAELGWPDRPGNPGPFFINHGYRPASDTMGLSPIDHDQPMVEAVKPLSCDDPGR